MTSPSTFPHGVFIAPTPGSSERGVVVEQFGPSGSMVGPMFYNQVTINTNANPTGDNRTAGFYMQLNSGGENERGHVFGVNINHHHNAASTADGDHIAIQGTMTSSVPDTGAGEMYGVAGGCFAEAGAVTPGVTGLSGDVGVDLDATVDYRCGARLAAHRDGKADTADDAAALVLATGAGFKNGTLYSLLYGQPPIQPDGNVTAFNGAQTVANVLNLTNLTVTGFILKSLGITISGAGEIVTTQPLTISSVVPQFVLHEQDGPTNARYWNGYANGGCYKIDFLNSTYGGRTNRFTLNPTAPVISGSRGGNAAVASIIAALVAIFGVTDSTTA
jgi:hypothetical protein